MEGATLERKTHKPKWKFTEREKVWIREYFKSAFNATAATRAAYGGTEKSCRVKGWRKSTKFAAILEYMFKRRLFQMQGGVDAYLVWLEHGDRQLLREIERRQSEVGSENSDLWPYPIRK
jgi:hypothetical protein